MDKLNAEASKYNNTTPPPNFDLNRAIEIRERIPVHSISSENHVPHIPPQVDQETKYEDVPGTPRYLVEQDADLGIGGFAHVHKGWDRKLGKYVAVKILLKDIEEMGYQTLTELEAKTLAKLSHPGIPEVYDLNVISEKKGESDPVIIMEYIKGETLADRIDDQKRRPLTPKEATTIISQTASTLDYMAKHSLSHGDIKSDHIILTPEHIKILDFGRSNWANKEPNKSMSPGFTAPELEVSVGGDEFSVAATAYQIVFRKFIEQFNLIDTINSISTNSSPYRLSSLDRENLIKLFSKALAVNPDDRFKDSIEFAENFSEAFKYIQLNPQ